MKFAMSRRNEIILIVALTLLGAALRAFQLGASSLWLDELFSVLLARRDPGVIIAGTMQDTMPPLYYLLLHFVLRFNDSESAARALSTIFSIAAIPWFYALARDLFDQRVASIAALLLVLNPLQVFYAQEARMYALLVFCALAAMFFFARAWRKDCARDWAWFTITMTCAFYTHSVAFLNLLALDLFVLTQVQMFRVRWRALVIAHIVIGVLFAPWLAISMQQVARVQSGFWGAMPSPLVLITTPHLFLFSNVLPMWLMPFAFFAALGAPVFGLLAAWRAREANPHDAFGIPFALALFLVPLIALYGMSLVRPIFVERTILPASLGLYLVLAWTALHAPPRVLTRGLIGVIVIAMMLALPSYYFDAENQKPPMRDAARALTAQFRPGDAIAHTSDSSALAFAYYAPELPNDFLAGDLDYITATTRGQSGRIAGLAPKNLQAVIAKHARVWLVVALDHNVEYQRARVIEFDQMGRRSETLNVGGIWLILYVWESQ
jgi:uncharacterized membrane protein